jgi:type II secretory pathway pseudopilin PulG
MPRRLGAEPRSHSPGGHTLWEMLLVLALLGVVAVIVAPSLGARARSPDDGVTAATAEVIAVLAEARLTALDRGCPVEVLIDPATAKVWSSCVERGERRVMTSGTLRMPAGAMLAADAPRVRFIFDAAGTASGGPIDVRGSDGVRRVAVDPWSGVAHAAAR